MTSATSRLTPRAVGDRPKFWLIDDETIILPRKNGELEAFRLRIWRSKGQPAIVLVSGIEGHAPPYVMTAKIANVVYRGWLKFIAEGMYYYEFASDATGLQLVDFVGYGHGDRLTLTSPAWHPVRPATFFRSLGEVVEL